MLWLPKYIMCWEALVHRFNGKILIKGVGLTPSCTSLWRLYLRYARVKAQPPRCRSFFFYFSSSIHTALDCMGWWLDDVQALLQQILFAMLELPINVHKPEWFELFRWMVTVIRDIGACWQSVLFWRLKVCCCPCEARHIRSPQDVHINIIVYANLSARIFSICCYM
jgi:hypothetical protein